MSNFKRYIVNPNGYYFIVEPEVPIDEQQLKSKGTLFFEEQQQMYQNVMERLGLDEDEIAGCEYVFIYRDGKVIQVNDRGFGLEIEEEINQYLTDFIM